MSYCFVPECNRAQGNHTCQFFSLFFFSAIFAELRFVEIQKFCYHDNVTKRLLFTVGNLQAKQIYLVLCIYNE